MLVTPLTETQQDGRGTKPQTVEGRMIMEMTMTNATPQFFPPPRKIGYARVSTDKQDTALQLDALNAAGVPTSAIFTDKISGSRDDREGLREALESLDRGVVLVVWRIDRLGRSLRHLLTLSEIIEAKGATLVSLCEGIDMGTPAGRMVFSMLGAVAQFERDVISLRTRAGLAAAAKRGVKLGAKAKLPVGSQLWTDVRADMLRGMQGHRIARKYKVSEATLYKTFPGGRAALLAAESGAE